MDKKNRVRSGSRGCGNASHAKFLELGFSETFASVRADKKIIYGRGCFYGTSFESRESVNPLEGSGDMSESEPGKSGDEDNSEGKGGYYPNLGRGFHRESVLAR
jgi:hypothetical protein